MHLSEDNVLKALSTVDDPDLKRDLVSLGMIQDLTVSENKISFKVVLTTPACPLKEVIKNDCIQALEKAFGELPELDIFMTSNVTTTRNNSPLLTGL